MWRRRLVCWIAGGLVVLAGHEAPAEENDLTVMTYNLRYASNSPPNSWPERRPAAAAMIRELRPDVIGTQEGLYQQLKDLAADLPEYEWLGLGREGGSRGEFMAVFYRPGRLEPLEYDHYWLSDAPELIGSASWGNRVKRMVTWVKFRDLQTKQDFYFINTHFDHQVQESREKSAALVLDRTVQLETLLPVLLVGDLNAIAGQNPVYDMLVNDDAFVDTWTAAETRGASIATFHDYRGPVSRDARIDWILARGPVQSLSSKVVTFALDGQYPSDHFPVVARLRLGPP